MKLAKIILAASALALAGGAYAADKQAKSNPQPGFNNLDANHDGFLTRAEARADNRLSARFNDADTDKDGKLTRAEYLSIKGQEDMNALREKAGELAGRIGGGEGEAAAGGTSPSKSK